MIRRLHYHLAGNGLGATLLKSVGGATGVSMLGMAFTFLLGWQLARGLGAAGYGIYGVAMAVVSMLGVPSQFGLPQLLTREVAAANAVHDWGRLNGVVRWALGAAIWSSIGILALLIAWLVTAGPGLQSRLGNALLVGSLLVPLIAFGAMAAAILRGLLRIVYAQMLDGLMRPALHSAVLVVIIFFGITLTPAKALGAGVLAVAIAVAVGGFLIARSMPTAVYSAIPQMTPSQWRSSALPMALTEGLRVVQGQAAILVLSAMVSMADVGKFRVATSLMTLLVLPISVISLVTGPHVSRLAAIGDRRRLRVMLVYSARGMVASVAVLLLPFVLAGNWLIENIFGLEYAGANRIFLMLAIGVLAYALFGAGANALNMLGHQKHVTRASLISVLVLCLLLWPAIVFWGNLGAAAAVSIASALWGVLLWQDIRRLEAMDIGAWAVAGGGSSLPRRGK